jgi:arsenate reductase (thioredoxin)
MSETTTTDGPVDHALIAPETALQRIADDLAARFRGIFAAQTVERYVFESYTALARTARIKRFLVPMTETFARDRLIALAQSEGSVEKPVPEVLFVCVHNAGRSQMAMAMMQARGEGRVHVRSAGSAPGDEINPLVVEALAEIGLDLEGAFPKPLTDDVVRAADYVITMGCGDACPIYPGKRYLDWELADPANEDLETVRAIRDEVGRRVDGLLEQIVARGA